jgi:DNA-binding NarL/FixJ family response regulator
MTAAIRQEKNRTRSRVFIVDDHPIVRQGLKLLIDQESDLAVCGEAENARSVLPAIRDLKPDIAIIDISLGHDSGIELMKNIRQQHPDLPLLVLSMHDETLHAERALRAGARGYVMKQEAPEKVISAIRQVLQGNIYVSDALGAKLLNKLIDSRREKTASPLELLSDRELQVFQLLGRGFGTRQVADKLNVSIKTVEAYRANIKDKLNLKSSSELVQHAIHWVLSGELP